MELRSAASASTSGSVHDQFAGTQVEHAWPCMLGTREVKIVAKTTADPHRTPRPQRTSTLYKMCTAHTTCYKCTLCGKKVAMTLSRLTECEAYLDGLARGQVPAREDMLRSRMAVGLDEPVHLVGRHSFWAWSWTDRADAFILYPRRICIAANHIDVDWECSDCGIPAVKEDNVWRMIRDELRGQGGGNVSSSRASGDAGKGVFDLPHV